MYFGLLEFDLVRQVVLNWKAGFRFKGKVRMIFDWLTVVVEVRKEWKSLNHEPFPELRLFRGYFFNVGRNSLLSCSGHQRSGAVCAGDGLLEVLLVQACCPRSYHGLVHGIRLQP